MSAETSVAIIGLGSRGLGVLERILTLAAAAGPAAGQVRVEVIDPRATGAGIHAGSQPDYLLLNTTAAQVSMFPDEHTVGDAAGPAGPNLWQWVTERGLRVAEDGFTIGPAGRPIRPTDFLPRRVLGEYLAWFAEQLLSRVPDHVRLTVHRAEAIDLADDPDGTLRITLSDGTEVLAARAFLTTGYTPNLRAAGHHRSIAEPYPLPGQLEEVGAGQTVAVGGFGLSGMDVMSCLTVGRGGRFVDDGERLRYLPSGREPKMLFYSRSGAPCRARPKVVEFGPRYQAILFNRQVIDEVRRERGAALDFDADVWPLIHAELRVAYRRAQARLAGLDAEQRLEQSLAEAAGKADPLAGVGELLAELDDQFGGFEPNDIYAEQRAAELSDSAAYQNWLVAIIEADLAEGALGFSASLVKATLDILRDLRDTFRYVVDFGGLTPQSLDRFHALVVPAVNRAVVGPQYERHVEFLALLEAGVLAAPFGPSPTVRWDEPSERWELTSTLLDEPYQATADWLASAWIDLPGVEGSASPLLNSLSGKGWIRSHRPGSRQVVGIDIDAEQHPIDRQGRPDGRIWVLGPLCEGATFYNNLVPSPATYSRPMHDAHRCVSAMFAADREFAATS